jgi:DNA-binding transcriptional MerR regulator
VKYSLKDLAKKLDISPETLTGWFEKELIVQSLSHADVFSDATLHEGEAIKKFLAMGYSIAEIQKIRREIGLPVKDDTKTQAVVSDLLTVGELAEQSGVNTRTIKFWEEKGLIHPCQRSEGGFRLFTARDVELVKLIKDLQMFNYTLSEIGNILRLVGRDDDTGESLKALSVDELEKIRSSLEYLITHMREIRQASSRVESLFARRLRIVARYVKYAKKDESAI